MVLGPCERIRHAGRPAVDGRVGRRANVELGELVELDVDLVLRVPFALRLDLLGLFRWISIKFSCKKKKKEGKEFSPDQEAWRRHRWPTYGWQS